MPPTRHPLSRSVEDYLKAIYTLTERGEAAATSAIAEALAVQPASVTGMVKRLDENGLVEHVPYRGVRLTEQGAREALRVVRRHRILETYLHEQLGYSWDDLHEEAESLEHAASDRLIERMAAALEDPSHDPHGAPIPTSAGEIEAIDPWSLADAEPGSRVTVRCVPDEDPERLRSLGEWGLVLGATLEVLPRPTGGEIVAVRVGGASGAVRNLDVDVAEAVLVQRG